jgi:hypothetical protein
LEKSVPFRRICSFNRQRGAAVSEFIVAMLGLGVLALGSIQVLILFNAKTVLNNATFEAARAGSVHHAQRSAMMKALARNLIPLYISKSSNSAKVPSATDIAKAYGLAWADLKIQLEAKRKLGGEETIAILSPSKQAFNDDSIAVKIDGKRQIPNEHLLHKSHARSKKSGVSLQDANILKIEVTYGYKMDVPIVNKIIARTMLLADKKNALFYLMDPPRLPLVAQATVRMQSNAYPDRNASIAPVKPGLNKSK